jgi:hypothetical protein
VLDVLGKLTLEVNNPPNFSFKGVVVSLQSPIKVGLPNQPGNRPLFTKIIVTSLSLI